MTKSSYVQQDVEVGNVDVKNKMDFEWHQCHMYFLDMWDA